MCFERKTIVYKHNKEEKKIKLGYDRRLSRYHERNKIIKDAIMVSILTTKLFEQTLI